MVTPTDEGSSAAFGLRPRTVRALVWIAGAAVVVPVLVAGLRAAARGWYPAGDDAYAAIGARDVFSSHPPLLGYWASASRYTHIQMNHPGPLLYDLLAVPVRLLGPGAGVAVGTAAVNATALALVIWLARRNGGATAALVVAAFLATLTFTIGSELLFDPWTQFSPILPFALVLAGCWAALSGDELGLPLAVVAGSFALETHLSYVVLVPTLVLLGLVGQGWFAVRDRRRDPAGWPLRRRRVLWSTVGALVIGLVAWVQPLYEQFSRDPGNMTQMARSYRVPPPATPSVRETFVVLGGTLSQPPFWLPPTFSDPTFHLDGSGRPFPLSVATLLALVGVLVLLGWGAWRRGDRMVVGGVVTSLAGLVAGFATILNMPLRPALVPTYLRWLWPLTMWTWATIALGLLRAWRARTLAQGAPRTGGVAVAGAAVAVLLAVGFGAASMRTVDNGSASFPWAVAAGKQLAPSVVRATRGKGPILVRPTPTQAGGAVMPLLMAEMQAHGVPFVVDDITLVRQLGSHRAYDGHNAGWVLVVAAPAAATKPPKGYQVVGVVPSLTPGERAEQRDVEARLVARLRAAHGIPLLADRVARLPAADRARFRQWSARVAVSPADAITHRWIVALSSYGEFLGRAVLDVGPLGRADVQRLLFLDEQATHGAAVLLGPVR